MPDHSEALFRRLPLARFSKLVNLTLKRQFRLAGCDITREQEIILRELGREDGINQVKLAGRVGQDRNNLSRTLGILENRGLVKRAVRAADMRNSVIHITDEGRALHAKAFEAIEAYWDILFDGFEKAEIENFTDTVARLLDNLSAYISAAPESCRDADAAPQRSASSSDRIL